MCGEKMVSMIPHRRSRGSPPRMRGKGSSDGKAVHAPGITPAYAGKSMVRRSDSRRSQGSPPRMRGKDAGCLVHHKKHRITPAYAGKRCLGHLFQVELRDHPRVCGEKMAAVCFCWCIWGSPPRMRGKEYVANEDVRWLGITPAYAGKSLLSAGRNSAHRDHPRVCGEKAQNVESFCPIRGSPPRMRGKATDQLNAT